MRSSLVVRASDCQCTSCNGPRFDPSIRRHSGIWGAADEAVLNIVRTKKRKNKSWSAKNKNKLDIKWRNQRVLQQEFFFARIYEAMNQLSGSRVNWPPESGCIRSIRILIVWFDQRYKEISEKSSISIFYKLLWFTIFNLFFADP